MHHRQHRASRFSLAALAIVSSLGFVLSGGCVAKTAASDPAVKCTPGAYVFCRCQNRDEGTKLCNEDGHSFGKCDPCESATNPAIPDAPGTTPVEVDAGRDAQQPGQATCGDKVVQDGEDCDDGNKVEDDGCDSSCHLAGTDPLATRSCPGVETHVWSKPVTYVGTTKGSTFRGNLSPNCNSTGNDPTSGSSGPDRVFNVMAHKSGKMTVTTSDTDYDSLIYVTQKCVQSPTPITYLTCAHNTIGVGGETMSFPVTDGQSYSVIVDGAGISKYEGVFRLTISIQ
jgi:cysteine-rich repeat protein